jgi:heat shock protein HslJ
VTVRRSIGVCGVTLVIAVVAAGCGWDDGVDSLAATEGLPSIRADVEAHDWVLDPDDSSLTAAGDAVVTLSVEGDEVSGRAGCNAYHGSFSLGRDGSVEIGDLALTRMACDEATMKTEDEFVSALEQVDQVEVDVDDEGRDDQDTMVLTGPDDVRLEFRSYDATDLLAGTWTVVNVATGDAIESVVAGTEPTVTFADDGTLTVTTGCNAGGGDWELDGHDLSIGPLFHTMKACDSPRGVMDQEAAIYAALDAAATVEIAPGSLTILDDAGHIMVEAER